MRLAPQLPTALDVHRARVRRLRTVGVARMAVGGVLLAGAAVCLAPAVHAATFGDDQRKPLPQSRAHLEDVVGILASPDGKHTCTAFCLSSSVIATAGHCVLANGHRAAEPPAALQSAGAAPSDALIPGLEFRVGPAAARRRSPVAAQSGPAEPAVTVGTRHLKLKAPINATEDWSLVRLAAPVCSAGALALSTRTRDQAIDAGQDGRVMLVGFHRDLSLDKLAFEAGCEVEDSFPDRGADAAAVARDFAETRSLLLHRCDTGLGSSGAPLIVETLGGPEVVGLNIGTYHISRVVLSNGSVVKRMGSDPIANTAVSADVLAAALARFPGREMLSSGAEMIRLQERLSAIGLYAGPLDGRLTTGLRIAIVAYERMRDRPVTGLATHDLLQRLAAEPPLAVDSASATTRHEPDTTGSTR